MKNRMKNRIKLFGIIALVAVFGFTMAALSLTGCDNGTTGGSGNGNGNGSRKATYVSQDGNGNKYTLEINESGGRSARSAALPGDEFKLSVEYPAGSGRVKVEYTGYIGAAQTNGEKITITLDINGETITITIVGTAMTVINGKITNEDNGNTIVNNPNFVTPVSPGGSNPFIGTWVGTGATAAINLKMVFTSTQLTMSSTNVPGGETNPYTYNGTTAIIPGIAGDYLILSVSGDLMLMTWSISSNLFTLVRESKSGGSGTAPSITTSSSSLPNGTVDVLYPGATLTATGTTPMTWKLDSGSLPTGLTLSAEGRIAGTPTKAGTFSFTVRAINSAGTNTQALSITIVPGSDGGTLSSFDGVWRKASGNGPNELTFSGTGAIYTGYYFHGKVYADAVTKGFIKLNDPILRNIQSTGPNGEGKQTYSCEHLGVRPGTERNTADGVEWKATTITVEGEEGRLISIGGDISGLFRFHHKN